MGNGVKVLDQDGEVIAEFYAIKRKDNRLIVDGKALGVMRMDMILTPPELLKGFKMALSWGVVSYIMLVPYFALREVFRRCFRGSRRAVQGEKQEGQ
jgi:hypothetical protein